MKTKLFFLATLLAIGGSLFGQGVPVKNLFGSGVPNANLASVVGTTYVDQSTSPATVYTCTAVTLTPTTSQCTWTAGSSTSSVTSSATPPANCIAGATYFNTVSQATFVCVNLPVVPVNYTNAGTGSSVTTLAAPALNVLAGNLLVVGCHNANLAGVPNTVSDTAGNTFIPIGTNQSNAGVTNVQQFYAKNTIANAADIVSCNWAGAQAFDAMSVIQFAGADTSSPLDQFVTTPVGTSSASLTTGTFTTTSANEIIVAFAGSATGNETYTPGTGYTILNNISFGSSPFFMFDEYQAVSSIQTGVAVTATQSPAAAYLMVAASFKITTTTGWVPSGSSANGVNTINPLLYGVTMGAHFACDSSITNGQATVTTGASAPIFTTANTVGAIAWMTNVPCTTFTNLGTLIVTQTTITMTGAHTATLGATASGTCTANCHLIWGPDDSAGWAAAENAWGTACQGSGSNLLIPAGLSIVQSARLQPVTTCSNGAGTGLESGMSITGVGPTQSVFVPSPNFAFTSCNPYCFGGISTTGSWANFGVFSSLGAIGAGFSGKILFGLPTQVTAYGLQFEEWGGNTSGTIGLKFVNNGGGTPGYNILSDAFGATGCDVGFSTALQISQCTRNSTLNIQVEANQNLTMINGSIYGFAGGATTSVNLATGASFYGSNAGQVGASQPATCFTLTSGNTVLDLGGGISCGSGTTTAFSVLAGANTIKLQTSSFTASGSCFAVSGGATLSIFDNGQSSCSVSPAVTGAGTTTIFGNGVTGTAPAAGNVVLGAGFGTSPTVTAVTGGDQKHFTFTLTAGSGAQTQATSTVTYTFPKPFWAVPGSCRATQIGGTNGQLTFQTTTLPTITSVVFTPTAVATASSTIFLAVDCQ